MDVGDDIMAYGPPNLPDQSFSQRQGTLAAAMPPPLARLDKSLQFAAAADRPAQDNERRQQNTHKGRQAHT